MKILQNIIEWIKWNWFPALLVIILILLCWGLVLATIQEGEEWIVFKQTHDCVKVGHKASTTSFGPVISINGQVSNQISSTPSQTGWKCNDGVTYWNGHSE